MKTKTLIRILAVTFALSMLTGYVVYSQKQQMRRVAPGSKASLVDFHREQQAAVSNFNNPPPTFAPGSKSLAPILSPGSKSAPVFILAPRSKPEVAKLSPPTPAKPATNQVTKLKP